MDVLSSTEWVMSQAEHVSICTDQVEGFARAISENPPHIDPWQKCDGHFVEEIPGESTARYVLLVDALNFCFWPCEGLEYDNLSRGVSPEKAEPSLLAKMDADTLCQWIPGIPQAEERSRLLREVGTVITDKFDGEVMNLLRAAGKSAIRLVELVLQHFPGFRDAAVYKGRQVFFNKRAQIFVADIYAAFKGKDVADFKDINQLTMFADYRVPQILRDLGILVYTKMLANAVDARVEIAAGSAEEIEIRAATVQACAMIQHRCPRYLQIEIDWYLWQEGERRKDDIPPHHRTLTVFY